MRCFLALTLAASLSIAADFTTGQAARLVIGQRTFTAQAPKASASVVGAPSGLAFTNGLLFVADANRVGATPSNHRVLVFDTTTLPAPDAIIDRELSENKRCPVCVGSASLVLGQPDFEKVELGIGNNKLRLPVGVATDGVRLAVADTDNNRVLIWNTLPTTNAQPANVVVGQPDFNSNAASTSNRSLRGPQGVWLQNGKLFVADTGNHRVLIWNSIPTSNHAPADVVLGQPDFTTFVQPDLTKLELNVKPTTLLNPVSVTSDGLRLYVSDLGHNRVLIWNSIPTQNQQPADIALGQPDTSSAVANNSSKLCEPTGEKDDEGNDIYPRLCAATLDFPRFALSDGQRLFVADGGNDRVLIYNSIPTASGVPADVILGQQGGQVNMSSDNADPLRRSSADSIRTPMGLAWDGANLYVSDPFNRRVLVFTLAERAIPYTGVRNAASREIYAVGTITFAGTIQADDEVTVKIMDKEYKYKIIRDDTFANIVTKLSQAINAGDGDPNAFATPNTAYNAIVLTARAQGAAGNDVSFEVKASPESAKITFGVSGPLLSGGQDAAKIAPGSLITILGDKFTDRTVAAPADASMLPTELGGVRVYIDGIQVPLLFVSPTQINAQLPWEVLDSTSLNAYVRTEWSDGRVTVTNPVAIPVIKQNPGIFAFDGPEPRRGIVKHYSSHATATISVDGTGVAGEIATVKIYDREYKYTVQTGDKVPAITDALIALINQDPEVEAFKAVAFSTNPNNTTNRIRIRARGEGRGGEGIPISVSVQGSALTLTATNTATCCANQAGALVTDENPAVPGETIVIYATGLGLVAPDEARLAIVTGAKYDGIAENEPTETVSSISGGKTANVLHAGLVPGMVGVYEVHLELNSDIPTNPITQLYIAQDVFVSNIITFPVLNPATPGERGQYHSLALKSDGTLVSWGMEGHAPPSELTGVTAIAVGLGHSLALKNDGTVVAWGANGDGQSSPPAELIGVTAISAGGQHSLALKSDGTVVAWGSNVHGQATPPAGLSGVVAIAAGGQHSLALKSDGTVVGWGWDIYGQATPPPDLKDVVAISAGAWHSLALKRDGTVVAWGLNNYGQGVAPEDLSGVVAIAAGGWHNLVLKSDGTVAGWGANASGQATPPEGLSGVVKIAAGGQHSLALKSDGTVVGWGWNNNPPSNLTDVIAIAEQ